jgi:hypothetical protein
MSLPPIPEPEVGWLAAAIATLILVGSIVLVFTLWCVDSAKPPSGSLLPQPVEVTTTPQYAHNYLRRT